MKSNAMGNYYVGGAGWVQPPDFGMTDDAVDITVFSRGIALFTSDDERVRRIHWVLCKLNRGSGLCRGNFGSMR